MPKKKEEFKETLDCKAEQRDNASAVLQKEYTNGFLYGFIFGAVFGAILNNKQ